MYVLKLINMDKALENLIKVYKQTFKISKKDEKRIKKQVSYLEYSFYDILESYDGKIKNEKIGIDSLIIFFGYVFGILINNESELEIFVSLIEASYLANKVFKDKS